MSRRYWLPIIAVVGLAISASAHAQPKSGNSDHQANTQNSQPKVAAQPQQSIPAPVQADINRIARALETANAHPNAAVEEQRAKDDLKAQQDMAKWAWIMLIIGGTEAAITFVGVILVGFTLSAAKRSAVAAEKALAAQDRPHITIESITIGAVEIGPEVQKNTIQFGFNFQNYGEDIAFLKAHYVGYFLHPKDLKPPRQALSMSQMHWPVPPNQGWGVAFGTATSTVILTEDQRRDVNSGAMILYCIGEIWYGDTGGAFHEHDFIYNFRILDRKFVPFNHDKYWKYT